jgi:DNA-3-methyladenine glycosylase
MVEKLTSSFYEQENVVDVAKELIGKIVYTNIQGKESVGRIVETEAYSFLEKACHAHLNRRTRRTETLFAAGGTSYVYLCYGIHHLFNVVTNKEGIAEAVLIRAVEPLSGIEIMQERRGKALPLRALGSGPGKLSQALGITTRLNGMDLFGENIWIGRDTDLDPLPVISDVRIGIDYAGEDAFLPWRFLVPGNTHVSVAPKAINSFSL